jgi:glycine/D-amino acid oxidase-like deaminating enzyme
VVGPDDRIGNFLFVNGFSGHGLQQSPAMGRGIAEWITAGGYETLDLSPLHIDRIRAGQPLGETAII